VRLPAGGMVLLLLLLGVALYVFEIDRDWRVAYDGYGKAGVEETEDGQQVHYRSPMPPSGPRRPTPP
jgi:YD repeat-containing protein